MKAASSALAGPNDATASSATSAKLAILITSSLIGHEISQRYEHSSTKERMQHRPVFGEGLGSPEPRAASPREVRLPLGSVMTSGRAACAPSDTPITRQSDESRQRAPLRDCEACGETREKSSPSARGQRKNLRQGRCDPLGFDRLDVRMNRPGFAGGFLTSSRQVRFVVTLKERRRHVDIEWKSKVI